MQDFKKLRVWHAAHRLALDVHRICDARRFAKYPGLRSQILRAAQSVSSNIAEGCAKQGAELARFLGIAVGSVTELENDLLLARDLGLITLAEHIALFDPTDHVRRMLIRLQRAVRDQRNTVVRRA